MTTWQPKVEVIARTLLGASAASISFASIPATYEHLRLVLNGRSDRVNELDTMNCTFNNDGGANYYDERFSFDSSGAAASETLGDVRFSWARIAAANANANFPGEAELLIPCYARTVFQKMALSSFAYSFTNLTTDQNAGEYMGRWASTAAINRVDIFGSGGNFIAGTIATLYGIR